MSDIAIRAENLGKMYRIGGPQKAYSTFRESITHMLSSPVRRASALLRGQAYGAAELEQEIWALKDVSFEIKHGEVVGIIGHNGAGKSTLLKILSQITEPTKGYVDIYGRVGALLEVGTGFHPELTGRENIYLNGAILGMSRKEIDRKFDEIVDFAGVEKFIDTPVKHYSSGMGLRLGFAVAAHLEPDILVVDEVLAVGDAEFQKKCLGKMDDVAGEGRTVLLVSHNMASITNLCSRVFVLQNGIIAKVGPAQSAIDFYLLEVFRNTERNDIAIGKNNGDFWIESVDVVDRHNKKVVLVRSGQDVRIQIRYNSRYPQGFHNVRMQLNVCDHVGTALFACSSQVSSGTVWTLQPSGTIFCEIPQLPLNAGEYTVRFWMKAGNDKICDFECLLRLTVNEADYFGTGILPSKQAGAILVKNQWEA